MDNSGNTQLDHTIIGEVAIVEFDIPGLKCQLGTILSVINNGNIILVELVNGEQAGVNRENLLFLNREPDITTRNISDWVLRPKEKAAALKILEYSNQNRVGEALDLTMSSETLKRHFTIDLSARLARNQKEEGIPGNRIPKGEKLNPGSPNNMPILGKIAMVHPHLTTDPINYQGNTGMVINYENQILTVSFDNGKVGYYSDNALLLLKSQRAILKEVLNDNAVIDKPDCKSIWAVLKLISSRRYSDALRAAASSSVVLDYCTISSHDWLESKRNLQVRKRRKNSN